MRESTSVRLIVIQSLLTILLVACCAPPLTARQQRLESQFADPFTDALGASLDIEGDLVALGAPFYGEVPGINTGGAFIFRRSAQDPTVWDEVDQVLPSDGLDGDRFAWAVDMDGDAIAVGASEDTTTFVNEGSIYIFRPDTQNPGQWQEVAKLNGDGIGSRDNLGSSVDLEGGLLAAGAPGETGPGAVYIFEQTSGPAEAWNQVRRIEPPATHPTDNEFGFDIALDGDVLAVASSARPTQTTLLGAVFIYHRNEGGTDNWGLVRTLQSSDSADFSSFFGTSIALDADVLMVGDTQYESEPEINPGGVFVFRRDLGGNDSWGQEDIVTSPNGADNDGFGASIDFDGNVLAVGTPFDHAVGSFAGTIALFDAVFPSPWAFVSELVPLDWQSGDQLFGYAVAVDQGVVVTKADTLVSSRNYVNYDLHFPTQDPDALFVDGFESGDVTVWSNTVP